MRPIRRAIIVDDLPPARDHLRDLLEPYPNINIVGEAGDLGSASRLVGATCPDLVFLDSQLGRENGFDLLPLLTAADVIFVTAYDNHAVRAFETNALDYLLKPVGANRLALSLGRLGTGSISARVPTFEAADMVALQGDQGTRMVALSSITLIVADRNYTSVHIADGSFVLTRRTMSAWEQALPSGLFVRIDRSVLVRLTAVLDVTASPAGNARLKIIGNDAPITITRRGGTRLIEILKSAQTR